MKDVVAPITILLGGPVLAIIYFVGGLRESINGKELLLVLGYVPIAVFFGVYSLRWLLKRTAICCGWQRMKEFASGLEYIERFLLSLPFIYVFFFSFAT